MNLFQRVNLTASLAVLGAVGVAYADAIAQIKMDQSLLEFSREQLHPLLLTLFILLFKVKTMLDDHQHFGESRQQKGGYRHLGFLLALLSWFFWILAAYFLFAPARASELMIFSIAISTAWIAVHVIELIREKKRGVELAISLMREKWLLFNVSYIICLGIFLGWIEPVVPPNSLWPLIAMLGLLVADYLSSRSYPEGNID